MLALPAEAVPKRILDAMNVEGLTWENVASHLQVWSFKREPVRVASCADLGLQQLLAATIARGV